MDDMISRQAAINALGEEPPVWYDGEDELAERNQWRRDVAAIKALPSAQPVNIAKLQPNCNQVASDCISRAAAIEIMRKAKDKSEAHRMLLQLPSAQPERKNGKWIERNPRNSPDCRLIECSECGNAYIVGYNINYDDWIDGRNFCMKCGADLRGGGNVKNT